MKTQENSLPSSQKPASLEEARQVLQMLRQCRLKLNQLHLDHAATYADIAVQLLRQSMNAEGKAPGSSDGRE